MTTEEKAAKWDALEAQITACYINEDGTELTEEQSENIDITTIGELAAIAFGFF